MDIYSRQGRFDAALESISKKRKLGEHKFKLGRLNKLLFSRLREPGIKEGSLLLNSNIAIVTAANDKFLTCALSLLLSLKTRRHVSSVIVFNLGLSPENIKLLEDAGENVTIASDLAPCRESQQEYINHYRFKIEAAAFAPIYDLKASYFLWIDSCSLVVNELDGIIQLIEKSGYFACQPDERLAGIRMINHVPQCFGRSILDIFSSPHILARQLVLFGVHGYSLHSPYFLNVIYEALLLSMLLPESVEGEKFATHASDELKAEIEGSGDFIETISFLNEKKIYIRSPRWMGARHDLFLYSFLFYRENFSPLPQYGWIEDHDTKGLSLKNKDVSEITRNGCERFERSMLWSGKTPIVLHRGRFC